MAELRRARDEAAADLVELRLDGVEDLDVAGALDGRKTSVIVTCRPAWEGGRFDGSEEVRLDILAEAMRLGAEYVDVELRADRRRFSSADRGRVVLSHHDFDGMPGRSRGPRARDARGAGRHRQACRDARAAHRLPGAPRRDAIRRAARRDCHGADRPGHPALPVALRIALDVRRHDCPWPGDGARAHRVLSCPARLVPYGDLRDWRRAARAFGLAGDAQRGVRRTRDGRGVRAARDGRRRRVSGGGRRDRRGRRERHRAAEAGDVRACVDAGRPLDANRRREHLAPRRAWLGRAQLRRRGVPVAVRASGAVAS